MPKFWKTVSFSIIICEKYLLILFYFRRNLEFLNKNQVTSVISVDPEYGRGELMITVPSEAQHMISEGTPLRVGIEFSLEKPQSGLQFVMPDIEGTLREVRLLN